MSPRASQPTQRSNPTLLHAGASIAARKLAAFEDGIAPSSKLEGVGLLDLFEEPLGSLLFWGAMSVCAPSSSEEWRHRYRARLVPYREHLRAWRDRPQEAIPNATMGAVHGLGAPIYVLSVLGRFLEDEELIEDAEAVARMVTAQRISRDRHFDVVEGSAGTILALLALESVLAQVGCGPSSPRRVRLLEAAAACAEHLLAHRVRHRPGGTAWPAPYSGNLQSGFAHGAAGIRFALARFAAVRPSAQLSEAIDASMAFEDSLYLDSKQRWLPFPGFDPAGPLMSAWCWGPPGIALSLLTSARHMEADRQRAVLERAIEITAGMRDTREDFLCCGNLGRAMILDYAQRQTVIKIDGVTHPSAAQEIAVDVLRRLKKRGDFGWAMEGTEATFSPSLMKGVAGVGYAFLYLAEPRRIPMILCLEPASKSDLP